MRDEIRVFLTVDVGPAGATLGRGHEEHGEWEATGHGLSVVRDVLRAIEDRQGVRLPASWLPRADGLIERQLGERLAIFRKWAAFFEAAVSDGHEVGWMPQVYTAGSGKIDVDDLTLTHQMIAAQLVAPRSVRMGDCYHDNDTMRALDTLGLLLDCSAVPGRKKYDRGWRMNWIGTPTTAYHPSVADYRRPGSPQLRILELPLTVVPIRAPYDAAPLMRYFNPCMRRELLDVQLRRLMETGDDLVAVLHPDEVVMAPRGGGHPLIAHSADALRSNLLAMFESSRALGREISFRRLEECADDGASQSP